MGEVGIVIVKWTEDKDERLLQASVALLLTRCKDWMAIR